LSRSKNIFNPLKKNLCVHYLLPVYCSLELWFQKDRIEFLITHISLVLNPGQRELEVWNTLRSGRENFYRALDTRIEFEFGVGKNLQTAFYINSKSIAEEHSHVHDDGIAEVEIETEFEWSFSNEWKYKLSDPVANAIGSALYAEITAAPTELELEFKVLLDKKVGKTLHALNLVAENEWESEVETEVLSSGNITQELEQESEFKFEFDYGFSYNINTNWNFGFEVVNRNKVEEGEWNASVLYAGPGFSYVRGPIWVNFSVMPQVTGLIFPDEVGYSSGLLLDGYEKLETRLLFSYAF